MRDTRSGSLRLWDMSPEQAALYQILDEPRSLNCLGVLWAEAGHAHTEERLQGLLSEFIDRGLVLESQGSYVGLALALNSPSVALDLRARELRRLTNQEPTQAAV